MKAKGKKIFNVTVIIFSTFLFVFLLNFLVETNQFNIMTENFWNFANINFLFYFFFFRKDIKFYVILPTLYCLLAIVKFVDNVDENVSVVSNLKSAFIVRLLFFSLLHCFYFSNYKCYGRRTKDIKGKKIVLYFFFLIFFLLALFPFIWRYFRNYCVCIADIKIRNLAYNKAKKEKKNRETHCVVVLLTWALEFTLHSWEDEEDIIMHHSLKNNKLHVCELKNKPYWRNSWKKA